ncbi:MAG: Fe(2+)-trafficking protein [Phycisphaerales bacterium]|nr:Fe(2+)-trafficking protein [Phycisphaerales bacterium]
MSDLDRRIAQFQNMAQADPENEMAHFSLGRALNEAGRHAEAAESFLRCTELAPSMSVAYQLAGEALLKTADKDKAAQLFTRGYTIAAERGEFKPRDAIAALLKSIGREVPEVAVKPRTGSREVDLLSGGKAAGGEVDRSKYPPGTFFCTRTGRPGTKMSRPPFKGPVGQWIHEHISQETFNTWIGQGTKVINELRLDLSREQDAETYDEHMREYLGIDEDLYTKLTGMA